MISPDSTYNNHIDLINSLIATGLVPIGTDTLKLLTDQCQCVMTPDGKTYVAENKAGRLTNCVMEQAKKKILITIEK